MADQTGATRITDWPVRAERYQAWWQGEGTILHVLARRDDTGHTTRNPQAPFYHLMSGLDTTLVPENAEATAAAWLEAESRARRADRYLDGIGFYGDAFPFYDTHIGPGNLATFLGSTPDFAVDTVWYNPCLTDPGAHPTLRHDPESIWFQRQQAVIAAGVAHSQGRYPVSMPDLVENLDTLASLRGTDHLLFDLLDRPEFVTRRLAEINATYFSAFEAFFDLIAEPWGGNVFSAFCIWGPGKTAKVQCDAAAMISPDMFAQFVVPALRAQCDWLDFSMFHLDGTQAIRHLDHLLAIDALDAIEWTPQVNQPQGGDPAWYDLYRRIRAAGKSVQAINVQPVEVIPLLDAVGPDGMFIMVNLEDEPSAQQLVAQVDRYLGR